MITNSIGMKLKLIPAGEFLMGSPDDEAGRQNIEGPQHQVRITRPYYMGLTEVTQSQWIAVMGSSPWKSKIGSNTEGDEFPATSMSWDEATAFCEKLSKIEGKAYRLPTEAEWEYACRSGSSTSYSFGSAAARIPDYAWCGDNAGDDGEKQTYTVAQKRANSFGLYDMHGNVWEWCSDFFSEYEPLPVADPQGPTSGSYRVFRGGCWHTPAVGCRSAFRARLGEPIKVDYLPSLGFRLALSPSGASPRISTPTTSTPPMSAPKPPLSIGDTADVITNSIGIKLKLIPAGEFLMGSSDDEAGHSDYEKPHPVKITKPYFLGVTEVTQEQWHVVMKTKPWEGKRFVKEGATYPATYVSWHDAVEYCAKLSESEGKSYRLPTEAEWEFGCRGGKSTAYSFGPDVNELSEYAWVMANAFDVGERYAHEAGTRKPNNFGLHDMHGNVLEWCSDWYNKEYYSSSAVSDPMGATAGSFRVFRGGGWDDSAEDCRSAYRGASDPSLRDDILGFRLALSQSSQ